MPHTKKTAQNNKLAQVISSVVSDKQSLAKQILPITPPERFEKVGLRLLNQIFKVLQIGPNGRNAIDPTPASSEAPPT